MFSPIVTNPSSLYNRIVERIKAGLQEGKLKPGDRLPPERELCQMLGVSRTSLREAMKVLAGNGIITIRHGQGVFVAEANPKQLLENLAHLVLGSQSTIKDLFEIRRVLETEAAGWAAERATPEQIGELAGLMAECAARAESGSLSMNEYEEYDHQFHYIIAVASQNALLVRIMHHLMDVLRLARQQSLGLPGRADRSIGEHLAILEAIQRRDAAAARERMLAHIAGVERSIAAAGLSHVNERGGG